MTYVAIYKALVFLIEGYVVIALQQLTDVSDNRQRYMLLSKLGVSISMLNRALFKQIGLYFLLPIVLAIVHSVVGIIVANNVIIALGKINVLPNILLTVKIFLAVYGLYFLVTFFLGKSIVAKT